MRLKVIPSGISFIIIAFFLSLLLNLTGCKKEYASPEISLSSVTVNSLTGADVKVEINLGEGQKFKAAKLVFEDLTILSSPGFEKTFELTGEQLQSQTINVMTNLVSHDFAVTAVLETEKYVYSSEKKVIRFPKNNFSFIISESSQYHFAGSGVGLYVSPGSRFGIGVHFQTPFLYNSVEVKLNGTRTVNSYFDFNEWLSQSDGSFISYGDITLPESIPPGDYEVDIYIDGNKFIADKKIRVLAGQYVEYDRQYPGERRFKYSHFLIGDKLYLIGGNFGMVVLTRSPVWEFDLKNKTWTPKNDVSIVGSMIEEIYPFTLQSNGTGYIALRNNDNNELWKYNDQVDSWQKITDYPGLGKYWLNGFIIDNIFYLGGGNDGRSCVYDFWSFNLTTQQWVRLKDFTQYQWFEFDAICTSNENAYLFYEPNRLMEYNPALDKWTDKARFTGPIRFGVNMVFKDNNLFLFGGMDHFTYVGYNDCFQYSTLSDTWSMNTFLPLHSNRGISFLYDNKIFFGLGHVIDVTLFTDHSLYQFRP